MSTLQVANLHFTTTGEQRIEYTGNNVIRVQGKGLVIPKIDSANTPSPEPGMMFYNTSTNNMVMMANTSAVVTIPSNTTVDAAFAKANAALANASGTFAGSLAFGTSSNISIGSETSGRVIITSPSGDGTVKVSGDGTNYAALGFAGGGYGYVGSTTNVPFHIYQNGAIRLTANVGGYIGVATTTPIVPLHVRFGTNNNIGFFTNTYAAVGAFNDTFNAWMDLQVGPSVYFKNTGSVGIGTTSPGYLLDVGGAGATGAYSRLGGMTIITANTGYEWWTGTYSTAAGPWQLTYRKLSDGTWNVPLHVDTTGNVGIGSTTPLQKLEVVGLINSTDTASTNRSYIGWKSGSPYSETGLHLINVDNSSLLLGTNNTVRAKIDVNGYVTKPYQPYLRASATGSTFPSLTTGLTIPYNTILEQVGSNYNTSTYRFTAPVAGVYAVYATIEASGTNTTYSNLMICKNGGQVTGTYKNMTGAGYQMMEAVAYVKCAVSDFISAIYYASGTSGTIENVDARNSFHVYFLG